MAVTLDAAVATTTGGAIPVVLMVLPSALRVTVADGAPALVTVPLPLERVVREGKAVCTTPWPNLDTVAAALVGGRSAGRAALLSRAAPMKDAEPEEIEA